VDLDTSSILLDTPFCIQRLYRLGLNSLENVYTLWGCEFLKERLLCIPIPSLFLRLVDSCIEHVEDGQSRSSLFLEVAANSRCHWFIFVYSPTTPPRKPRSNFTRPGKMDDADVSPQYKCAH
jgi:hypothetical protein